MIRISNPLFRKIAFCLYAAFVTGLSLMPAAQVDLTFTARTRSHDFEAHTLMYFFFTTLALLAYAERKPSRVNAVLAVLIYGGTMELLQTTAWVNRTCQISDMKANVLGSLIAVSLFPLIVKLFGKLRMRMGMLAPFFLITAAAAGANVAGGAAADGTNSGPVMVAGLEMEKQANDGFCAPAVLASLLKFHGMNVAQETLAAEAGSTEDDGTNVARLLETVNANHLVGGVWRIGPVFEATRKRGEKMIARYNGFAGIAGSDKIRIPEKGFLAYDAAFAGANLDLLRKISTQADMSAFTNAVVENISAGCPLIWGVILGVAPEPSVKYKSPPAGHLRLITGYDENTGDVFYADTWGNAANKRIPRTDALAITMTLHSLTRTNDQQRGASRETCATLP